MVRKNKQEIMAMIICVIVAFALWLYVMSDVNPVKTTVVNNVPVELVNTESLEQSNLALLPDQHFTVNLSISGKTSDIFNVSAADFSLVADMSTSLKKGDNTISVEIKNAPKGITVNEKAGALYVIKVKLDSLTEKSIPVVIKVTGDAKQGYSYLQPVPKPSEVIVSGAAAYVNSVTQISGSIDISNASTNVTGSIPVKALDIDGTAVSYVKTDPKYLDVTVPIKPSKEVPVVIKTSGKIASGKTIKNIKPEIEKLIIMGDQRYLDQIKQIETEAIDLSTIKATSTRELLLNIPTNISVFNDTRSINVNFVVENIVEKALDISIDYINEDDQYNYSLENGSLSITVSGAESIINSDSIKDITAQMDLSGYTDGTHSIPVKINLPDGVVLKNDASYKVNVTITKK